MTEQNPELTDVKKDEANEDKALEAVQKIANGELTFEDINDEKLTQEIHQRFVIEEEKIDEPKEVTTEGKITENVSIPEDEKTHTPEGAGVATLDNNQEFLKARKERLDELNSINQKIDSGNKKLGDLEKLKSDVTNKKYDDYLDEDTIKGLHEEIKGLKDSQKTYFSSQTEEIQKDSADLKNEKLFLEVSNLQLENPGLKTNKPIKVLNAQYNKFIKDVGGLENVDKFLRDKTYRESMESQGHTFPMDEKDYKSFETISSIVQKKNSNSYPTLGSAYYDYRSENGLVQDEVKQAALAATQQTVDKLTANKGATTLSPEDGSIKGTNATMSKDDMQSWLLSHPEPANPQEERLADAIHKQLLSGEGGTF